MSAAKDVVFAFGPYRLMPGRRLLVREGRSIKLGGRALDILHLLLIQAGEKVSKQALIKFAWPQVFVDESNLKVHISNLRRTLEDTNAQATYIATVVGHGYQFVGRVSTVLMEPADGVIDDPPATSSLPAPGALVGRGHDVEAAARALEFTSLVTLVGPGGVGKTRLAIAIAHASRGRHPGGVYFVDLSATADPELVAHRVATALGIRANPGDLMAAVIRLLRDKRILMVLDNCEHVLHAAATLAALFVETKTGSRVLATSREPLGVRSEHVRRVEPLAFPGPLPVPGAGAALAYPSVELFALRALDATGYRLVDGDAATVAGLCEALDGLPLAIEIAAAKLEQFSPAELLESVRHRLRELRNDDASTHFRHRTLWALLDWSYRLLSSEESALFRLLSVFAGSFEWTDVAGMARLMHYAASQTTTALGGLVDKSLLSAEIDGDHLRYRYLESARGYAAERLLQDCPARNTQLRHAQIVLAIFERSESEWAWADPRVWRARYEVRTGDLRKALDWCFSAAGDASLGIDLAIAATRFWNEQSSIFEQLSQVERALSHCTSKDGARRRAATLAMTRAWCMAFGGQLHAATDDAWNDALRLAQLSDDPSQRLSVGCGMALFLVATGRHQEAIRVLDDVIVLAGQAGDRASLFDGERLRAMAEVRRGNLLDGQAQLERLAMDLAGGVPQSKHVRYRSQAYVSIHGMLALANWLTGRPGRAIAMVDEMVLESGQNGHLMGQSRMLALVALPLAFWSGHLGAFERYSIMLRDSLDSGQIALWGPVHRFYASLGRHARGDPRAVNDMRRAVDDLVHDRFLERTPMYLGVLAEALFELRRYAEADEAVESAFELQRRSKEGWCMPELLRIKARLMAGRGERDAARAMLRRAREKALASGARSLELRAVNDLVQMASGDGSDREAFDLLMPLYATFEDGRATRDLERSARLLAAARSRRVPAAAGD